MKTTMDYYVGQRVKMYDKEDRCNVYGHITAIKPNEIQKLSSIVVKWGDISDECEHFGAEFNDIKSGNPDI